MLQRPKTRLEEYRLFVLDLVNLTSDEEEAKNLQKSLSIIDSLLEDIIVEKKYEDNLRLLRLEGKIEVNYMQGEARTQSILV